MSPLYRIVCCIAALFLFAGTLSAQPRRQRHRPPRRAAQRPSGSANHRRALPPPKKRPATPPKKERKKKSEPHDSSKTHAPHPKHAQKAPFNPGIRPTSHNKKTHRTQSSFIPQKTGVPTQRLPNAPLVVEQKRAAVVRPPRTPSKHFVPNPVPLHKHKTYNGSTHRPLHAHGHKPFTFTKKMKYTIAAQLHRHAQRRPRCERCRQQGRRMRCRPCHGGHCHHRHGFHVYFGPGDYFLINGIHYRHHYCGPHFCYYYNLHGPYDDFYYCTQDGVCRYCNDYSCFYSYNETVLIDDPALSRCVRAAVGKTTEGMLLRQEVEGIERLTCVAANIRTLRGIEYLTGLKHLDISKNCIEDFSILKSISVTHIDGINTQHPSFCQ